VVGGGGDIMAISRLLDFNFEPNLNGTSVQVKSRGIDDAALPLNILHGCECIHCYRNAIQEDVLR